MGGNSIEISVVTKPRTIDAEFFGLCLSPNMVDTSDATAVPSDIRIPETAYARGEKIEGTMENGNEVSY